MDREVSSVLMKICTTFWSENMKEIDHLEDLSVSGKIVI
jgi:hypothetical protein